MLGTAALGFFTLYSEYAIVVLNLKEEKVGVFGNKLRIALLGGVALCLVTLAVSLTGVLGRDRPSPGVRTALQMEGNVQMGGFDFIQSQNGRDRWRIQALKAELFEDEQTVWLERLDVRFDSSRGLKMSFIGDRGKLHTRTRDFELFGGAGDVEMVINDDQKLVSKSISWDDHRQRVFTADPVLIQGPKVRIHGQGAEVSLDVQSLKVLSDVRAEIF